MNRQRRGYTLTETMIVVAIMGTVIAMAPRLILQSNRFFIMARARSDLQREARSSMYIIQRSLRQAQSASIAISRAAQQPYYSRIAFTTVQGTQMVFYQNGRHLIQQVGTKTTTLSKNLSFLTFMLPRSDDLTIVSVVLTFEKRIYETQTQALHMASDKVRVMN